MASRRGSLTQLPSGAWRIELTLAKSTAGKRLRHRETHPGPKAAAEKRLLELLNELQDTGSVTIPTELTLRAALEKYLASRADLKPRTQEIYAKGIEQVSKLPLGTQPVATIRPIQLVDLYQEIPAWTVGRVSSVIGGCFTWLLDIKEIKTNPHTGVKPTRQKSQPRKPLASEAFPTFVAAALEEKRNAVIWPMLLATGMRPGEVMALRWEDLDLVGGRLSINHSLYRPFKQKPGEPKWLLGPPKTEAGRRTLVLGPDMVKLLKQHRAQQNQEKLLVGLGYTDHGLVFCSALGEPLWGQDLRGRVLKRILKRAGLPLELCPYSLRHGAGTALMASGENLKIVSTMMGHGDVAVTARYYLHVDAGMLGGAASKLAQRMFG